MQDTKMPLTAHLGELRSRILFSLCSVFVAFIVTFNFSEQIFSWLMFPLRYELDFSVRQMYFYFVQKDKLQSTKLVFLAPAEAFWMNIKVAFVSAVIVSLPMIFTQFWKFVSPGLLPHEKKYVLPFVIVTTFLFLIGSAFCFFIVLPFAMGFLLTYKIGDVLMPMLSVGQYIDFCLKFILAFGVVFELPVVIVFLTRLGLVTPKKLSAFRRYAILCAFIVAAFLTPTPDAFNQTLMAIPMILLYELGIWISPLFVKKQQNQDDETNGVTS